MYIPLPGIANPSRAAAACDAFQAMTATRPYRKARRPEEAIEELRRCAGTQFDPGVVQALVAEVECRLEHAQR